MRTMRVLMSSGAGLSVSITASKAFITGSSEDLSVANPFSDVKSKEPIGMNQKFNPIRTSVFLGQSWTRGGG